MKFTNEQTTTIRRSLYVARQAWVSDIDCYGETEIIREFITEIDAVLDLIGWD